MTIINFVQILTYNWVHTREASLSTEMDSTRQFWSSCMVLPLKKAGNLKKYTMAHGENPPRLTVLQKC